MKKGLKGILANFTLIINNIISNLCGRGVWWVFSPYNFWKPPLQFFSYQCWCTFFLALLISYPTTVSQYHDTLLHHWIEMLGFDKGGN